MFLIFRPNDVKQRQLFVPIRVVNLLDLEFSIDDHEPHWDSFAFFISVKSPIMQDFKVGIFLVLKISILEQSLLVSIIGLEHVLFDLIHVFKITKIVFFKLSLPLNKIVIGDELLLDGRIVIIIT